MAYALRCSLSCSKKSAEVAASRVRRVIVPIQSRHAGRIGGGSLGAFGEIALQRRASTPAICFNLRTSNLAAAT
jgi:hypothetical protein